MLNFVTHYLPSFATVQLGPPVLAELVGVLAEFQDELHNAYWDICTQEYVPLLRVLFPHLF